LELKVFSDAKEGCIGKPPLSRGDIVIQVDYKTFGVNKNNRRYKRNRIGKENLEFTNHYFLFKRKSGILISESRFLILFDSYHFDSFA